MRIFHRPITADRRALVAIGFVVAALVVIPASAFQDAPKAPAGKSADLDIQLVQPKQAKTGDNQFELTVKGPDGKPLADAEVAALFVMPAMPGMSEMRNEVKLKSAGAGKYTGMGKVMMAGKWDITVTVKQNGKELG